MSLTTKLRTIIPNDSYLYTVIKDLLTAYVSAHIFCRIRIGANEGKSLANVGKGGSHFFIILFY